MSEMLKAGAGGKNKGIQVRLWVDRDWDTTEFKTFLSSIEEKTGDGDIIYDKRNRLVRLAADPMFGIKRDIIVKRFNLIRKYDQLRYCFIRSKAVRSLETARALEKAGVHTPRPVGLFEVRGRFGQIKTSNFITQFCAYDFSLMELVLSLRECQGGEQLALFRRLLPVLAGDIRKMHDAGIFHHDLHDGNVLVKETDPPVLYYIDLNRAQIQGTGLTLKQRAKDLARFNWGEDLQRVFVEEYMPTKVWELMGLLRKEREKRVRFVRFKRNLRKALGRSKRKNNQRRLDAGGTEAK